MGTKKLWPKNIRPREFDCIDKKGRFGPKNSVFRKLPSSGPVREEARLLAWELQTLREELGVPVYLLSTYRPIKYNRAVGSKDTSQHVKGRAADIRAKGISTKKLHATILRMHRAGKLRFGGVGVYHRSKFVHVDTRKGRLARWVGN